MESKIYTKEEVGNRERKFGSQLSYYPVMIIDREGWETPALFTRDQVKVAIGRARKNPEDIPEKKSFLERIFG